MQRVVGVKFSSSKVYSFSCGNMSFDLGEEVIVENSYGLSLGKIATPIKEIEETNEELKPIVRKATSQDKARWKELCQKATKDIPLIKEKVKKLGLEMKIVSAEYTFDASKIIIEFSADDRVDFRELLKELASALHVRIELHQVGQRDEVKVKGGLGPCGEICCCTRFLKDFEHVTVKMAKNQGLSLSPTKISGLCGRLMCCLAYENKNYEESLKKLPKINSEVMSPKGKGIVVYNDVLRERVSVKVKANDDSFTIYDFALDELGEKNDENVEKLVENNENIKVEVAEKPQPHEKSGQEKTTQEKPHKNFSRNKFKRKKDNKNGISNNG